jgi:hypothetical protein
MRPERVLFRAAAAGLVLLCAPCLAAGEKAPVPVLAVDHAHPSGAFAFRTPAEWTVGQLPQRSNVWEAAGNGVVVRFVYRAGEAGFDSMHVDCMLERLAGPMVTQPAVRYEYDFLSGESKSRRFLDSAFVVRYDEATRGYREWRQRNLTLVGAGESLCVIQYAPLPLWKKKSSGVRELLDAVLNSITLTRP